VYSPERFRRGHFSLSDYQNCSQACGGLLLLNAVSGDFDLPPGQYQLLVLERTDVKADVYFFTNKVDASKINALVRAESTKQRGSNSRGVQPEHLPDCRYSPLRQNAEVYRSRVMARPSLH